MSVVLPERFHPEVRLGRDRDSEVWLATDTSLDRPVLARVVGPHASRELRDSFTDGVRTVAAVTHDHLAVVYAASEVDGTAYAITEWAGGVTIGDRIGAGEPIPLQDFLPNAAGLADALAKLHAADVIHGAVGPDAVLYSAAHPAKLSPFATGEGTKADDTAALARTLLEGLAGGATELAPSQLAEGIPQSVDRALRAARTGKLDAAGLAAALRAAPSPAVPTPRREWSWRWVGVAAALFATALVVIILGFALEASSDSALLFPVGQPAAPPTTSPAVATTVTATPTPDDGTPPPVVLSGSAFDPFGDGTERDREVALTFDGQTATTWRTERYFDPLQLIKPGVGLAFNLQGTVGGILIEGSAGTAVSVRWAATEMPTLDGWEELGSAVLGAQTTTISVDARQDGAWLLWLTDLPPQDGGEFYYATVAEVRFAP